MPANNAATTCRDCGGSFAFSEDERRSFVNEGHLHTPSRCAACREARKTRQLQSGARPLPPAFRELRQVRTSVVCSACGQTSVVPFAPRTGRAVNCANCYRGARGSG